MQTEATLAQADVSELELVRRCQAGQSDAFDELVTRYRTRIFAMIYNMVHNEQDAWDLAQESFLKAWRSIKRFRGKSSFYTWMYRIVMNVTIDWLRKKQIKGGGTEFVASCAGVGTGVSSTAGSSVLSASAAATVSPPSRLAK